MLDNYIRNSERVFHAVHGCDPVVRPPVLKGWGKQVSKHLSSSVVWCSVVQFSVSLVWCNLVWCSEVSCDGRGNISEGVASSMEFEYDRIKV